MDDSGFWRCQIPELFLKISAKTFLPLVRSGTIFFTSRHQFSFFSCSNEACMARSRMAACTTSLKACGKWFMAIISSVYRCIPRRWCMRPQLEAGFTTSLGTRCRIFTAFSRLETNRNLGRKFWPCDMAVGWPGGWLEGGEEEEQGEGGGANYSWPNNVETGWGEKNMLFWRIQ